MYEVHNKDNLITRKEFEVFSEGLEEKTDTISETLDKHEQQIEDLNDSVNDIKISVKYLGHNLDKGLNDIGSRIDSLGTFLIEQNKIFQTYNDRNESSRNKKLEDELEKNQEYLRRSQENNIEKIVDSLDKISKFEEKIETFERIIKDKDNKRKVFIGNIISAIVAVIIAIINVIPALL